MTQVAQDETTSDDGVLARERSERADRIIRTHTLWGMGAGLIPVPMFDVLAVSAIQIDMLKQLAEAYDSDFTENLGKTFVTALTGGTFARFGASLIKAVPGVGTLVGGASMSVLSGASTYAVGQVAKRHYETGGNLIDIDLDSARKTYDEALESGKRVVGDLKNREAESKDVFSSLERLSDLRQKGVISEEEFEAKKREMLERL
ncbi:MAG: DUF697 domain-containing protein [Dehalococcoidia bacterium]|nr:DUF697 domain-containing protein [Dehalococcoidia bacterium]MYD52164.1 DUF697 domain-containing protein [Dehalococcoidia bacterium]